MSWHLSTYKIACLLQPQSANLLHYLCGIPGHLAHQEANGTEARRHCFSVAAPEFWNNLLQRSNESPAIELLMDIKKLGSFRQSSDGVYNIIFFWRRCLVFLFLQLLWLIYWVTTYISFFLTELYCVSMFCILEAAESDFFPLFFLHCSGVSYPTCSLPVLWGKSCKESFSYLIVYRNKS